MSNPVDSTELSLENPKAHEEFMSGLDELDRKLGLPTDDSNEFVRLPESAWGIVSGSNCSNWSVVRRVGQL